MVARRESRVTGVLTLEQARRMRHANEYADAVLFGSRDEASARILFEYVVDDLESRNSALPDQRPPFSLPPVGGAERGAIASDLALRFQPLERLEKLTAADSPHPRVVNLIDINVIRTQAPQALLNGKGNVLRREILREFLVAVPFAVVIVEIVAELRGDNDTVADVAERVCEDHLALALSICVGGVEERDPGIVGFSQQLDAALIVLNAPPAGADGPEAETNRRNLDPSITESTIFHARANIISPHPSRPARQIRRDSGLLTGPSTASEQRGQQPSRRRTTRPRSGASLARGGEQCRRPGSRRQQRRPP